MRKREVLGAALVAVVAGALVIASVVGAEDGLAPAASAPASAPTTAPTSLPPTATTTTTTATTATATTATTVTTTTEPATSTSTLTMTTTTTSAANTSAPTTAAPAVPDDGPQDAPADPRARVPITQVGWINIDKIGLNHAAYEGVWLTVLDVGPGHWPGSALPGGAGNVVFGGHRVTHSHPFRDLDQLAAGDLIRFDMLDGTHHTYAVTEQFIVEPEAMWIVDPTPQPILTLFACHPKGSARQRIVVRAALVS